MESKLFEVGMNQSLLQIWKTVLARYIFVNTFLNLDCTFIQPVQDFVGNICQNGKLFTERFSRQVVGPQICCKLTFKTVLFVSFTLLGIDLD